MPLPLPLLTLLFLFLSLSSETRYATAGNSDTSSHEHEHKHDLVRSSCSHASYPNLCFRTLSTYAGPAKTPNDLAQAAVTVSLTRARHVSRYIARVANLHNGSKREQSALSDCVDQISETIDDLTQTLSELRHLRRGTFRWQMSNVETWVSAALTNEDTCLDGFQNVDGRVKVDVKQKITNVARVTSNALYLINRLDEIRGRALVCSSAGNLVINITPTGVANATVLLQCGTARTTVAQTVTNPYGVYQIDLRVVDEVSMDPSLCRVVIPLPVATNCTVLPSTANLVAPISPVQVVQTKLGPVAIFLVREYLLVP
ncbi:hypothetical protein HHK36_014438 [Tetracentron sinense]|uniref:Pectinesterase inhibitor domain-containing protein n=1 Tax=Tetracentron sinense TaxID=13715 RepID=A0A835DIB6_TETSI|nr:hypothetical protein HHK36_014438 [Tetracentron sinense]